MADNWTRVWCGCETEHPRQLWRKNPTDKKKGSVLDALRELSQERSLGECVSGNLYLIRMHQVYPNSKQVAYVRVRTAFRVPNIGQGDNQEIYLLVEERDKHSKDTGLHMVSDIVFEHRYWAEGSKVKGKLKYGQFAKQLTASQLEASMRFLSEHGWLRATPPACRQKKAGAHPRGRA